MTDNYGASAVVAWDAGRGRAHLDHRRALVPLRRQERSGADAFRDRAQRHAGGHAAALAGVSASGQGDRDARLSDRSLPVQHRHRHHEPQHLRQDAGAFFATDSQYRALNTAAAARCCRPRCATCSPSSNQEPVSDSVAVFGQVNWQLTERATLTVGLRQTWERQDQRDRAARHAARWLAARLHGQRDGGRDPRRPDRRRLRPVRA